MADEYNQGVVDFLDQYGKFVDGTVAPAKVAVDGLLGMWKSPQEPSEEALAMGEGENLQRSAIAWTESRIKRPESVIDKINRKPSDFPDGYAASSIMGMGDILGARVVVYFPTDLAYVHELIKASGMLRAQKPATAYYSDERIGALGLDEREFDIRDKNSGYRSIHYYLELTDSNLKPYVFELQVRTLVDHVWASIEHLLGYKPGQPIPGSVHKQFELLSGHLNIVDQHFDLLRDEVQEAQNLSRLSGNDRLDFATLPYALKKLDVRCSQGEINAALKMLASNQITTWGSLEDAAKANSKEVLQNTYKDLFGSRPRNFTIIAMWALSATAARVGQYLGATELVALAKSFADKYRSVT